MSHRRYQRAWDGPRALRGGGYRLGKRRRLSSGGVPRAAGSAWRAARAASRRSCSTSAWVASKASRRCGEVHLGVAGPGRVQLGGRRRVVPVRLGEPVHRLPDPFGDHAQLVGHLVVVPRQPVPAQLRVDEVVDRVRFGRDGQVEPEVRDGPAQRRTPVGEQLVVAHEGPRAVPGLPVGVEHRVHPAGQVLGREARLAHVLVAGEVVRGAAAEHLGGVAKHDQVHQPDVEPPGRAAPQVQRPGAARVLDQRGLVPVGGLVEPLGEPGLVALVGGTSDHLQRLGPAVGDVDSRPLQQLVVELHGPAGLVEAARVGRVGLQVRARHVHAEVVQRARHGAGAATAGTGDEQQRSVHDGGHYPPPTSVDCGESVHSNHAAEHRGVHAARKTRRARAPRTRAADEAP